MLDIEYEILLHIKEHSNCSWTDVVNRFDPKTNCNLTDGLLYCLLDAHLIETVGGKPPLCSLRLTNRAWRAMASYEQSQKEKKAQQRQRRKDHIATALVSIVSAVVGGIIGLLHLLF